MKCPICGQEWIQQNLNLTSAISELITKRNSITINKFHRLLTTLTGLSIPPPIEDVYSLLIATKDVDDRIFERCLDQYWEGNHYNDKPLAYLRRMILNFDKNKDKIQEVEYKIYGKKPPLKRSKI